MPSPLDFLLGGGGQPTYGDPNTFDPNNPLLRGLLMAAQQQPQDAQAPAAAPAELIWPAWADSAAGNRPSSDAR